MADFDEELDASGLNCPLPILRAKKTLAGMDAGKVLHIIATDPGSVKDFEAFCKQTGNLLLASQQLGGEYQWRREGEYHLFNPETVYKLQHSTRTGRYDVFKEYTQRVDDQSRQLATLRGLFELRAGERPPVPLEEVEPVSDIVARFSTGAPRAGLTLKTELGNTWRARGLAVYGGEGRDTFFAAEAVTDAGLFKVHAETESWTVEGRLADAVTGSVKLQRTPSDDLVGAGTQQLTLFHQIFQIERGRLDVVAQGGRNGRYHN